MAFKLGLLILKCYGCVSSSAVFPFVSWVHTRKNRKQSHLPILPVFYWLEGHPSTVDDKNLVNHLGYNVKRKSSEKECQTSNLHWLKRQIFWASRCWWFPYSRCKAIIPQGLAYIGDQTSRRFFPGFPGWMMAKATPFTRARLFFPRKRV